VIEIVHKFEQIHPHMLLENEQLILGSAAALSDDLVVGQVFMGFFQRLFVRPYKRIEPFDDGKQFYDDEIYGVMLIYVNQLMIDNPEKIMLGNIDFVQKKIVEKGKGRGVFLDIDEVQFPTFMVPVFFDQLYKLDDFIDETDEKKQGPQQIDHAHNFCEAEGMGGNNGTLRGDVTAHQVFGGQKRGGNIDERKDKREGNRK
jgi:hypothetical protein